MQPETGYVYNGIGFAEAQDRDNEERCGVPPAGALRALLDAPAKGGKVEGGFVGAETSAVHAQNTGEHAAELRLRHGQSVKALTTLLLVGLRVGATNQFTGRTGHRSLVANSIRIIDAGALADIVDDGNGTLHDDGIPANVRGTVDYVKGEIDATFGAGITLPVTINYDHTDYTDFATGDIVTSKATGGGGSGSDEVLQAQLAGVNQGMLVPFTITVTEGGALTFVDDGLGNIIQTNTGNDVVGSVDYATGEVIIGTASGNLAGTILLTAQITPFGNIVQPGGAAKLLDVYAVPPYAASVWGIGTVNDNRLALVGQCRSAGQTNLVTKWFHFGEDPYRVQNLISGFPAGGHDNDPNL